MLPPPAVRREREPAGRALLGADHVHGTRDAHPLEKRPPTLARRLRADEEPQVLKVGRELAAEPACEHWRCIGLGGVAPGPQPTSVYSWLGWAAEKASHVVLGR